MARVRTNGPPRPSGRAAGVIRRLPSPADLKECAREAVAGYTMPPTDRIQVEALLDACTFDYEVVAGRDGIIDVLGLIIFTDAEHGRLLTGWGESDVCSALMSALGAVCPDLGADRVVVVD